MFKDKKAQAEFMAKGKGVYNGIRETLEAQYAGHIAAIDITSGEYEIGETLGQANDAIYTRFPDSWIYFVRIGSPEAAIALQSW